MAIFGAALALILTGCPANPDDTNGTLTMNLRGQVWTMEESWDLDTDAWEVSFVEFGESRGVTFLTWWQPGITNGYLNFSIGSLSASHLNNIENVMHKFVGWEGAGNEDSIVTISDRDTRAVWLSLEAASGNIRGTLSRRYLDISQNSRTDEQVSYIFVDRNVTISRTFRTYTAEWDFDGDGFSATFTYNDFVLSLRQGWNAVHFRNDFLETAGEGWGTFFTNTITISDPAHMRWVLFEREYD